MRELAKELAMAGVLAVIALTALISLNTTTKAVASFQYESGLSFSTLPSIYAGILLFLCLVCMGGTLYAYFRNHVPDRALVFNKQQAARVVMTVLLLLLFVLLLGKVFFGALCTVFLGLLFVVYGKRNITQTVLICVAGGLGLHVLFAFALGLRL